MICVFEVFDKNNIDKWEFSHILVDYILDMSNIEIIEYFKESESDTRKYMPIATGYRNYQYYGIGKIVQDLSFEWRTRRITDRTGVFRGNTWWAPWGNGLGLDEIKLNLNNTEY